MLHEQVWPIGRSTEEDSGSRSFSSHSLHLFPLMLPPLSQNGAKDASQHFFHTKGNPKLQTRACS